MPYMVINHPPTYYVYTMKWLRIDAGYMYSHADPVLARPLLARLAAILF